MSPSAKAEASATEPAADGDDSGDELASGSESARLGVLLPPGYVEERRDAPARPYMVYRAPDGSYCKSRAEAWRRHDSGGASQSSPRSASVGRERRSTPRPRRSSSSGTPARRVQFVADVAAELQSVSLDDGRQLAAAPVAAQQVDRLEDAVTYWDRGASSRRPPTERHIYQ